MAINLWWRTEIYASDPETRQLRIFAGPDVPGRTEIEAQEFCRAHYPYLKVIGQTDATENKTPVNYHYEAN